MKKAKAIKFTPHAEEKLSRLAKMQVTEEKVVETIQNPESIRAGYFGRKIAQSSLTPELMLRVVYEETNNRVLVVTIYPAKRERYV
ncbi:MAG: DUF4258 domain-containing protein [Candidatus Bathyarchaeales archaeon]